MNDPTPNDTPPEDNDRQTHRSSERTVLDIIKESAIMFPTVIILFVIAIIVILWIIFF